MNRCENYTLSCEAKDCSECDMFSWDGTGDNPMRDNMGNIPYTDMHIDSIMVVVDIYYYDGNIERGVIAHSIEFEELEHIHSYNLKVYKTLADVAKHNPVLYGDVKKIEVVGVRL